MLLSSSTICVYLRQNETALLEKMQETGELRDSEGKKVLSQGISCMELIQTTSRQAIRPFDTDVLQQKMHEHFNESACMDLSPVKEFLCLGLGKG